MNNPLEQGPNKMEREPSKDWFLENPPMQPKAEIASYVESGNIEGLRVPRRYSFKEGYEMSKTQDILFRTEHPDEYAGASGVGNSVMFGEETTPKDLMDLEMELAMKNRDVVKSYYEEKGDNPDEKYAGLSYSAWEVIPGLNKTIYQDDVITGKFHVFSSWMKEVPEDVMELPNQGNYMQIENGEVVYQAGVQGYEGLESKNRELVEFYQQINALEKFDPNHVPIMEFQQSDRKEDMGQQYFLQSHRGRNKTERDFILDESMDGYTMIQNVRGKTPPGGLEVFLSDSSTHVADNFEPRTSFYSEGVPVSEMREAQVVISKDPLEEAGYGHAINHFNTNILMKPQVTLYPDERLSFRELKYNSDFNRNDFMRSFSKEHGGMVLLGDRSYHAHVISDGRKAFISEPDYYIERYWDKKNERQVDVTIKKDGEVSVEIK